MSGAMPTEKKFEDFIEDNLLKIKDTNAPNYKSLHFNTYNRELCLIENEVLDFIQKTHPKEWEKLGQTLGNNRDSKFLEALSETIIKHGVVHVLRNGFNTKGQAFKLCFFEPKSGLNKEAAEAFKKNQFSIVRQLHYSQIKENNSIDTGIFLNGIPIITIELKNQLTLQNVKHAISQYKLDRDPKEPLLKFKRCLAHFAVDNDSIFMTTRLNGPSTKFLPFNKGIQNPINPYGYKVDYFWSEILTPKSLLDIIENFMHLGTDVSLEYDPAKKDVSEKKNDVLIFPRYHQLQVIRMLRDSVKIEGPGHKYLIKHTTGSGKSYSIGWLAHLLASLFQGKDETNRIFDTIIVVTDRKVLDKQLQDLIQSLSRVKGVVKSVDENSSQLKKYLNEGKDIIITTIQKFPVISKAVAELGDKTFAVIIDEVHSSQSGKNAKTLKETLSQNKSGQQEKTEDPDDEFEDMIRQEIRARGHQQNISFFGFTGTPKNKTLELFGRKDTNGHFHPFHTYTMEQSIAEGFTLNVLSNYTTYERFFQINSIEDKQIQTGQARRKLFNFVDSHEDTIQNKATVILDHFINIASREINGTSRGMIVVRSRAQCVLYFREINKQLEEKGITYRALVAFSGEVELENENERYTEEKLNSRFGKNGDIPILLKYPNFRLLIVSNKFQTGFDEPLLQSMYIDKKLNDVQCVQTLSRLNRTKNGKNRTFILDFVNSVAEITDAFEPHFTTTILDGETDDQELYTKKIHIENFHLFTPEDPRHFCKIYFDKKRKDGELQPSLNQVVERWAAIDDVERREEFRKQIQSYIRLYEYVSQIITYEDLSLEILYIFLFFVNRKLPSPDTPQIELPDITLEELSIRQTEQVIAQPSGEEGVLNPPGFHPGQPPDPPWESLSELIKRLNEEYGTIFSEADIANIEDVQNRIAENDEVKNAFNADNSEENTKDFVFKKLTEEFSKFFEERNDFYTKIQQKDLQNSIFQTIFDNVKNQKIAKFRDA